MAALGKFLKKYDAFHLALQTTRPVVERQSVVGVFFAYCCKQNCQGPDVQAVCVFVLALKRERET